MRDATHSKPQPKQILWLQELLQKGLPDKKMSCFHNETKLFESDVERLTVLESNDKDRILASIDRAGARIPYRCELYPSASSQLSDRQRKLGVMYSNIDRSYSNFPSFSEWFVDWVDGRMVAPDTGIIIDHYFTEVLLSRILPEKIRIQIPRLVILEIEAKGNRSKPEEKRLSLSAFNELRILRLEAHAQPSSAELDTSLLSSFHQISGERRMDVFIRREIRDEMYRFGTPKQQEQIVLLTRDLIMASSASAEDIDAFYLCPAEPEKTQFPVNAAVLAKIILETAVTLGKIRIGGLVKDRSVVCEGMWSGKNVMDWYKKRLRVHQTMGC